MVYSLVLVATGARWFFYCFKTVQVWLYVPVPRNVKTYLYRFKIKGGVTHLRVNVTKLHFRHCLPAPFSATDFS